MYMTYNYQPKLDDKILTIIIILRGMDGFVDIGYFYVNW